MPNLRLKSAYLPPFNAHLNSVEPAKFKSITRCRHNKQELAVKIGIVIFVTVSLGTAERLNV